MIKPLASKFTDDNDANGDDDNNTWWAIHDYMGSLAFVLNEPIRD